MMEICFALALLHLASAHIWKGMRYLPSLKFIAEAGWVIMLSGIYFIVRALILKRGELEGPMLFMIIGFILIILFAGQREDGFMKGLLRGISRLPVALLDGVGGLSNIVSYLRLFAVGMASREVALAFNRMAESVGYSDIFSICAAVLILVFGHTINMLLIAMSVIVHGIRLNILEFSGHMNMQWSGIPYKPFGGKADRLNKKSG